MSRELRNGDLVRVKNDALADHLIDHKTGGILGIVVDDIDAQDEVRCYHATLDTDVAFQWWCSESLEVISESRRPCKS